MNIKRRLEKLEERKSPLVIIVARPNESSDSAIVRWRNDNNQSWPENVLVVITNVTQPG